MLEGNMIALILWMCGGIAFILMGIATFHSKKEASFWANVRTLPMKDVKAYNRAVGKLWVAFGIVFMLLGLPFLGGKNSPWFIISIVGVMLESIAAMIVYLLVIQNKYEKK